MGDDTLRYVAHKSYCFYHQLIFSYVGRVDLFFTIRYTKLGLTLTHHIRKKQFFGEKWVKGGKALIFFCFCNWLLQTLDNSWGDPNVNGGDGMKQYSFTFEEIWVLLLHKLYTSVQWEFDTGENLSPGFPVVQKARLRRRRSGNSL